MLSAVWLQYCLSIGALLTLVAIAAERAARAAGFAQRWGWAIALAGCFAVPAFAAVQRVDAPRPVAALATATALAVDEAVVHTFAAPSDAAGQLVPPVRTLFRQPQLAALAATVTAVGPWLWLAASALVLLTIAVSFARLSWRKRSWTLAEVDGEAVWLSRHTGPAALGVVRTAIVIPRWVLALDARARSFMLLHEQEHVRAGDPRLLFAGLLAVAASPWNPFAWYLLRRLRLAIEIDCDARVLRRDNDRTAYGEALLEAGRRRARPSFALATFAEPRSQLERRLRRIAQHTGSPKMIRAACMTVVALSLTGAISAVNAPPGMRPARVLDVAADTVLPRLINAADIDRAITRSYPPLLRDAGIEGTATVQQYVSATGEATRTRIARSAGYEALDRAALGVAASMKFEPGTIDGRKESMWVSVDVAFVMEDRRTPPTPVAPTPPPAPPGIEPPPPTPGIRQPRTPPPPPTIAPPASPRMLVDVRPTPAPAPPNVVAAPDVPTPRVREPRTPPPPTLKRVEKISPPSVTPKTPPPPPTLKRVEKISPPSVTPKTPPPPPTLKRAEPIAAPALASPAPPPPAPPMVERARTTSGPQSVIKLEELVATGALRNADAPAPLPPAEPVPARPVPAQAATPGADTQPSIRVMPKLLNLNDVLIAIDRSYPPALLEAGVSARAIVWYYIGPNGRVSKAQVSKSSGYKELDALAIRIAGIMNFTAMQLDTERVGTWVELPISFEPGGR